MCLFEGFERDAAGQEGESSKQSPRACSGTLKRKYKSLFLFFFKGGRKISNHDWEIDRMRGLRGLLDQKEAHLPSQAG